MPLVSITRLRARAFSFVPMFMHHAQRSISQIRSAEGCISLALLKDRNRVFWTMTIWEDEHSMKAYMNTGSHRGAMPSLADWADEASVVHWNQEHAERPDCNEAAHRKKAEDVPQRLVIQVPITTI
jgi:quinol monooxygenase YgiN